MFDKRLAEGIATSRVIRGERQTAAHSGDRCHRVVDTSDVEQRRDLADAVARAARQASWRALESQLRGRERARTELVFESIDANVAKHPVAIAKRDEKDAQSGAARRCALDAGQCHCDLMRRCRLEP